MTLLQYYAIIKSKIEQGHFKLACNKAKMFSLLDSTKTIGNQSKPNSVEPFTGLTDHELFEKCKNNSHLESIHYLMYEYWLDRNDSRIKDVFDYVCIPNGVNDEANGINLDFTKWEADKFIGEIMKIKVKTTKINKDQEREMKWHKNR